MNIMGNVWEYEQLLSMEVAGVKVPFWVWSMRCRCHPGGEVWGAGAILGVGPGVQVSFWEWGMECRCHSGVGAWGRCHSGWGIRCRFCPISSC